MLKTVVNTSSDWTETVAGDWQGLLADSEFPTPFHSLEWQRAWFEIWGGRRSPFIVLSYEGDDLVGAYPLVECAGAWNALRAAGTGISDYLHPLTRRGYAAKFLDSMLEAVEASGAHLLDLHQIPIENFPLDHVSDSTITKQASCLVLALPESFERYVTSLSKSMRYEARRLEKPPFTVGDASITWPNSSADTKVGLDIFFDLHSQRWRKRGLPGAFALGRNRAFHYKFASYAIERDILRFAVLSVANQPIGALYAMRTGSRWFFYQSGFDPNAKAHSPGTVLVASAIRRAIEEGAIEFDFLRGDEPYKRRWSPTGIRTNCRLLKTLKSPLGKVGQAWNTVGGRIEGKVRARLEGRGLLS